MKTKSRASRTDWLDEGLRLLGDEGDGALTIEVMCSRMAKTKGSFYHHFAGRSGFVVELLEHWERRFTRQVIEAVEPVESPVERLRALGERTSRDVDLRLERTIRVWADREPAAREVLARVDRAREDFLREQFEAATGDPRRARLAARAHMAILVGTEMLYQDLSRSELRELNAFVDHLGFVPRSEEPGPHNDKESP